MIKDHAVPNVPRVFAESPVLSAGSDCRKHAMKQIVRLIVLVVSSLCGAPLFGAPSAESLPAFPGAEGFDTHLCTHGRGGRVLIVDSLEDNKQGAPVRGTFRWACEAVTGPRIVVFRVGGVLELTRKVTVAPDAYIAGQTAPGDGICITRAGLNLASNTLVRHLRFRPGDAMPGASLTKRDAFEIHGENIIVDHCSVSWTTDECFRVNGGKNVTLSHCFFGEGLHIALRAEMHNYGPALEPNAETGGMSENVAFHHCLLNGFAARSPLIGNGDREVHAIFANNVIYNYGGGKYPPLHTYAPKTSGKKAGAAFGRVDVIANYFKEGPVSPPGAPCVEVHGAYPNGGVHLAGNLSANHPAPGDEWNSLMAGADDPAVRARRSDQAQHVDPDITITDAVVAFRQVTSASGATKPRRDTVDERFVRDVLGGSAFRGTGGSKARAASVDANRGEFRAYYDYIFADPAKILERHASGPHKNLGLKLEDIDPVPGAKEYFEQFRGGPAPVDADADGLADDWEQTHGLNSNDANDNTRRMPSGYTAVEEYVNRLAQP